MGHSPTAVFGYGIRVPADEIDHDLICRNLMVLPEDTGDVDDIVQRVAIRCDLQYHWTYGDAPCCLFHDGVITVTDWEGSNIPAWQLSHIPSEFTLAKFHEALRILGLPLGKLGYWLYSDNK